MLSVVIGALIAAPGSLAGLYKVNSTLDTGGVCTLSSCTLREAIVAANGDPGSTIAFQFGIGGSNTISPSTPLPDITAPTTIDATTQPGYAGAPLVELGGSGAGSNANGFTATTAVTIRGFSILSFGAAGIALEPGSDGSKLVANYIGVNANGAVTQGNHVGISVQSGGNTIGGPTAAERNVISGNATNGIEIGTANSAAQVYGNYIGTDASGTLARPNQNGIAISTDGNTIGGPVAGQRNVISGNSNDGLLVMASNTTIRGNYIGTNAHGNAAVGNVFGIQILGQSSAPASTNEIGGGNVISGNQTGVYIAALQPETAQKNSIWGTLIGTAADGKTDLGNAGAGVAIAGGGGDGKNAIGGDTPSEQNTIAYDIKGIAIGADSFDNQFLINSIHDNDFNGIDLNDDGVTTNDPDDGDTGANNLLNFPVLGNAARDSSGRAVADVAFDGPPGALLYRFDFYASPACDNSSFGEGERWLGNLLRTVDANGDIAFNTDNGLAYAAPGSCITATATDPTGNTSEFSQGAIIGQPTGLTFTVNATDGASTGGDCVTPATLCSLFDAINAANATPGTDTIAFNLPGPSTQIFQSLALPPITEAVIIDGWTQGGSGYNGSPIVQVDGGATLSGTNGLVVDPAAVDGSTIRGLSITNFTGAGIVLGGPPSVVRANYVGLTPGGAAAGNGIGISVQSSANQIGGVDAPDANIVSGNSSDGISITGGVDNVVEGNRIGTNPSGVLAIANGGNGLHLDGVGAQTVGGAHSGAGNVISGNSGHGINVENATGATTIAGNIVGLNAVGAGVVPNNLAGVRAQLADGLQIGGASAAARNVIAGNGGTGILIFSSNDAVIEGNYLGLDATGDAALPNSSEQLVLSDSSGARVGGTTAAERNAIAGNETGNTIVLNGTGTFGTVIEGNYVGLTASGAAVPENAQGIVIVSGPHDNTIGGVVAGAGNVLDGSAGAAVFLAGAGDGNKIVGNDIGTDAAGSATGAGFGNNVGIDIVGTNNTLIGSTSPGSGNVIAGSSSAGIVFESGSQSNTIQGNYIGTDRLQTAALGNNQGIRFDANGGGDSNIVGPENVIANSTNEGVAVDAGAGNRISANSIYANGGKGIRLNGGNNAQAAPVLTDAKRSTGTSITGTLTSAPNTSYFVEYFMTPTCGAQPQGRFYLGFQTATTDVSGQASLSFGSTVPQVDQGVTATVTSQATNDTSEFSACLTVTASNELVVNTTADHDDGACNAIDCSLREAILLANDTPGPQTIVFDLAGSPPFVIQPSSPLPTISGFTFIDGTTQPGFTDDPLVVVDGTNAGSDLLVFGPGSDGSGLRALVVNNWGTHDGVVLQSGLNTIEHSWIGTTTDGISAAVGVSGFTVPGPAIHIESSNNVIGGGSGERNVIVAGPSFGSGNAGVLIDGNFGGASSNTVSGNYIGLDKNGVHGLGGDVGVQTLGAADSNIIGGATAASANVIAGVFNGIILGSSSDARAIGSGSNIVQSNIFGLQADGATELTDIGNNAGILDDAIDVWDLGSNIISDNVVAKSFQGIFLISSDFNIVSRNKIGTDSGGTLDRGNRDVGIAINHGVTNTIGDGNLIAFNSGGGIVFTGTANSNTISNNYVGTDATGTQDMHNGTSFPAIGINGGSSGNIVGPGNVVKFSVKPGVTVSGAATVGNRITQNDIDANAALGIDLVDPGDPATGVTPNDAGDGDAGPNDLQNYPVIASAVANATQTQLDATLDTVIPGTYRIEVYTSPACDASGNGEGATFVTSANVDFGVANQAFTITLGTGLPAGTKVTMTATSPAESTSEFSNCVSTTTQGSLDGSALISGDPPSQTSVDLTALGSLDWAIWGYGAGGTSTSLAPDVRKSGGSGISDLANIDPSPSIPLRALGQFSGNNHYDFSWSNGDSTPTAANVRAGLQHDGQPGSVHPIGYGFAFDVPADLTPRTVRIYTATHRASGQLTATLSDGSAPAFISNVPSAANSRTAVYSITYSAASPGQTLHVNWVETAETCGAFFCDNASIYAVALTTPNTLVVTDPSDTDGSTCGADCTLRQAINAANANPGSTILFDLPAGSTTIAPASNLPLITAPTTIDATTQPGYAGTPLVTLTGVNVSSNGNGFHIAGNNTTIRGFVITDWTNDGILVDSTSGNTIAGNYIGMNVGGIGSQNNHDGIELAVDADNNTIGGTGPNDRNVISGNGSYGIELGSGEAGTPDGNTIQGNYIGLRPDGTGTPGISGNSGGGIYVGGNGNTIGGTTAAARNYVAANDAQGILVAGAANVLKGNTIGLDAFDNPTANSGYGIDVEPFVSDQAPNIIGDTTGGGNVVSGNFDSGIFLAQIDANPGTVIQGNLIGTDSTGTTPIGNEGDGIETNDAAYSVITGNTVSGNLEGGLDFFGFGSIGNAIADNRIGTDATGTQPLGNTSDGIIFDSASGTVRTNVISGNLGGAGIHIIGPNPPGTSSIVTGNKIGTDATGTALLGNGIGIEVAGTDGDTIGGTGLGDGNVVSGNTNTGIQITGSGTVNTTVQGNIVGLDAAASAALPNATGVAVETGADAATIGGATAAARNVISGNSGNGLELTNTGSTGSKVLGNYIGTNAAGTQKVPNGAVGVFIASSNNNTVGTSTAGQGNVIAGSSNGFLLAGNAAGNLVEGNAIGTDAGGTLDLGNTNNGVRILAPANGNIVRRNTIMRNGAAGVAVPDPSLHNNITANSIDRNGGLGIDLGAAGVTANDAPDADGYQNFPTLGSVSTTQINGSLTSTPGQTYNVDLYLDAACDASGNGEGAQFLGTTTVTTDAGGAGTFTANVAPLPAGQFVTATATGPAGDTSEFSACASTVPPPTATGLSLTPSASSTPAGAARVKLADVPPSVLIQSQSSEQSAPVNQTPVNQTPVNQLAATNAPVNQTPINQTPVNQTPVNQSGFAELTQTIPQLGDIAISTIPLLRTGGWAALLAGTPLATTPQQGVTLRQVYALNPLPGPLQANATNPITLGELDLGRSPLGSVPAMAFALGKLPLAQIQTLTGTYTNWCTSSGVTGVDCTSATSTVLSAGLQGVPVNQTPVNQTPVNQTLIHALATFGTPVNQTPVNQTPINQTRIGALPVNQTPVNQTPVNQTPVIFPVNQLSLEAILAANAPVNQTPVNQTPVNQLSTPNDLFFCSPPLATGPNTIDCSSATATLGSAYTAHAVRPNVTLGDLRSHAPTSLLALWTLADLRSYMVVNANPPPATHEMTIGELLASLPQPNNFTLADVLLLVLGSPNGVQGLSFEGINVLDANLQQNATGGSTVDYRAQFTVSANGGPANVPSTVDVSSTVGIGFLYVPGSSRLAEGTSCGAAGTLSDPTPTTLTDGRLELTWAPNTLVGHTYSICFTVRPSIILGPAAATLDAKPGGGTTASASGGNVDVADTNEPSDAPASAPMLGSDSFYLSYLTNATDVDYYRFQAPATGTTMTFHLSHLPADYDLVVYGPPETALRPPLASGAVPLDEQPVTDNGVSMTSTTETLASQTLDDLRLQTDMPMVGVSASRGTDPEDVVVTSQGGTGVYTIQVTGYNGATSAKPYMLRVATTPPRTTSTVSARTVTGTVGPALPTLPSGLNTIFLVARSRLEGIYGSTRATNVMNALANDSAGFANLGFPNVTLSVDRFTTVQNAYAAWDANPGSAAAANGVVAAINGVIDSQIRSQPNGAGLKYVVIVGGDRIIPFARLDDFTVTSANESNYATTFDSSSDLGAALGAGMMLSDDPYGDLNPVPYLTRQLYIPELAVGRLVETPEDIAGTLNRFVSTAVNGQLNPTTSLVTGYDFLFDGASRVNDAMSARFGTGARTLLDDPAQRGDSWTLAQLTGAFLPLTGSAPSITSLNGHASHYQFQPPVNDTTGAPEPLFTTGALAGSPASLLNRLVFSMGCHSGLSVADAMVMAGGASTLDWPQSFAQKGVGAFLGNTGYGYGDSLVVAYSEELNKLFAQNIAAGAKVGNALIAAKQAYYGELGVFGVYDEKSMAEFTLYGLPMWGVANAAGSTGAAAPLSADAALAPDATTSPKSAAVSAAAATADPAPSAVINDPTTGLDAETFNVDVNDPVHNTPHPTPPYGTYWSGPDGVQVTHLRPIQPKALVGLTGTSAHGALITELSSIDTNCVDPVFDRPIFDLSATERELRFADVAFPSKVQTVRTFETPSGRRQQLVLVTGQFFTQPCATNSDPQVGVQRLFSHIAGRAFRSSSNNFTAPSFTKTDATQVSGNGAFTVDVTDKAPGTVKQVLVGVRSGFQTNWTFVNLAQSQANPARWTGGAPISGTEFEYFVQAVDNNGNVAVSTNKGFYFVGAPAPPQPTGGIDAALTGTKTNGWYAPGAGLDISVPAGVTYQVSIDGGGFVPAPPNPTITADGVHIVDIRASNGGTAQLIAPVDTTAPEQVFNAPAPGGTYVLNSPVPADYFCRDSGSGVVTPCVGHTGGPTGPVVANGQNIDTSSIGPHTFTIGAVTDAAGHTTAARTITYTVGYRKILFMSSRTSGGDIYSMNPDGTGVTQLTATAGLDEQPAWSPDGSKIAFASMRNDKNGTGLDIYVMDADGNNVQRLTSAKQDDTAPAWSPDGRKIAFQSKREGDPEIFVMNADGSAQTQLTFNTKLDIEPAWAPSTTNQRIAFISDRNGTQNVWTMNANGSGQTQITTSTKPDAHPSWSPDGTKIVFSSKRDVATGSVADLYTMSPNGSSIVKMTTTKKDDVDPTWSRDGQKIVFASYRDGNPEIYVMNATPLAPQARLTSFSGTDLQPDW